MSTTTVGDPGLIGASPRKHDGDVYLTGRATYVADMTLPGMVYVAVIRSPYPHARIRSIDAAAALADESVVDVLTGAEAAGLAGEIPHNLDPGKLGGHHTELRCLAVEKAVYAGQPVVAVVADTLADAHAAAQRVVIEYEPLPFVLDADEAVASGAPLLYEEWGTNEMISGAFGEDSFDVEAARCDHVLTGEIRTGRSTSAPMEPRAYLADWRARDQQLTLFATTQNPHPLRFILATALGLAESQIRVIAPRMGGAFGLKMHGHPEEVLACLLARRLERPVRWVEDRAECMLAGGREQIHRYEVAFDSDGRVHALRNRVLSNHGAASAGPGWGMAFVGAATFPTGYAIDHCHVTYTAVVTNKSPWMGVKSFGKEGAALVMERIMDRVAATTGLDPAAVRRHNFVKADKFPHITPAGLSIDSGNYEGLLDKVLQQLDYDELRRQQKTLRAQGRYLGIGIGFELTPDGADIPGALVGGIDTTTVKMDPSGLVTVLTGVTSPGNGNDTAIAQIVAGRIGVDLSVLTVEQGDSSLCPYGYGNLSSRSIVAGGGAALLAADDIAAKLRQVAAAMLHTQPDQIVLAGGMASVTGAPEQAVPIPVVAHAVYSLGYILALGIDPTLESTRTYRPGNIRHLPDEQGRIQPFATYGSGLHLAVVEVDIETGVVTVQRCVGAHDCGTVINPMFVDGQTHGGIAMGVGAALTEELAYHADGTPAAVGFKTYLLPRATDLPPFELAHQETPTPFNILGAKGAGESGVGGVQAAVVNAVNDALRPLGVEFDRTPLPPHIVLVALQEAAAGAQA